MDEIKKVNAIVQQKQAVRAILGPVALVAGLVMIGKFIYQKGITDEQKWLSSMFPEDYERMTENLIEFCKKHFPVKE